LHLEVESKDVHSTSYSSNANPWEKYYNGAWGEDGIGGDSTTVINEVFRGFPHVTYASGYSEHFLVCVGTDGIYLYTQNSSNMEDWDNGLLILTDPEKAQSQYIHPTLIGNGGDDKYGGNQYFKLYYGYDTDAVGGGQKMVRREIEFDK